MGGGDSSRVCLEESLGILWGLERFLYGREGVKGRRPKVFDQIWGPRTFRGAGGRPTVQGTLGTTDAHFNEKTNWGRFWGSSSILYEFYRRVIIEASG